MKYQGIDKVASVVATMGGFFAALEAESAADETEIWMENLRICLAEAQGLSMEMEERKKIKTWWPWLVAKCLDGAWDLRMRTSMADRLQGLSSYLPELDGHVKFDLKKMSLWCKTSKALEEFQALGDNMEERLYYDEKKKLLADVCRYSKEIVSMYEGRMLEDHFKPLLKECEVVSLEAHKQWEKKAKSTSEQDLEIAEKVAGGCTDGSQWDAGLGASCPYSKVLERARGSLLKLPKSTLDMAKTDLVEVLELKQNNVPGEGGNEGKPTEKHKTDWPLVSLEC